MTRPTGLDWTKIQTDLGGHPKVQEIPSAHRASCIALHVVTIGYCTEYLTDGFVTPAQAKQLASKIGIARPTNQLAQLVRVGLWHDLKPREKLGRTCEEDAENLTQAVHEFEYEHLLHGGQNATFYVHGFLTHQLSKGDVLARRQRESEKKQRWRAKNVPSGQKPASTVDVHGGRPPGTKAHVHGVVPALEVEVDKDLRGRVLQGLTAYIVNEGRHYEWDAVEYEIKRVQDDQRVQLTAEQQQQLFEQHLELHEASPAEAT